MEKKDGYKLKFSVKHLVWSIALFNFLIHFLVINNLEYMRDELLYFSMGNHPAAGYATTPPLVGLLAGLLQLIAGNSLFAVRLLPTIFSALIVIITAEIAKELGGKSWAIFLAALGALVAPSFLRAFMMFQPVFLDIFFWACLFYLFIKYINSGKDFYLVCFGILSGLAMLNKYLVLMLIAAVLVFLPFSPYRNVYRKKQFYFGMGAGFLIFLPNLIWQILNNFPVLGHMSKLHDTQLVHVDRASFLIDQVLSPFSASLLIIPGLIFLLADKEMRKFRLIGVMIIAIDLILCLLKAKSYYAFGVFPVLIAAGAVYWEQKLKRKSILVALMVIMITISLPILPLSLPIYNAQGLTKYFSNMEKATGLTIGRRFEDGSIHSLPQDYADMIGWEELTSVTAKAWQKVENKNCALIYCENYGHAGAITVIGKKYNLPEPVCFHDAFKSWLPDTLACEINEFIYINDELGEDVAQLFGSVEKIGAITNVDAREFGTSVYLCKNPHSSFNKFWYGRIKELD
ncbi:MAG: glycosyltransferase family 39 protein [Bacteroidales bacterium]